MDSLSGTTLFWLLFMCFAARTAMASNNDSTITCTMNCYVQDESSLSCWQSNENFFINQLINAIDNLSGLEEWIASYNRSFGTLPSIEDTVQSAINRTIYLNQGPMEDKYMIPILRTTLTEIMVWAGQQSDVKGTTPRYVCPMPDDYINDLWIYLFGCMCVVLVLTLVYVAVHMHRLKLELRKKTLL